MPLEMDYEFGRRAVRRGLATQEQLEECIEVLVALERVGSQKRLWQLLVGKGYLAAEKAEALRAEVEAGPAGEDQETSDDIAPPAPVVGGYVLAHVTGDGQARTFPLPQRLVIIGKDPSCDIVIDEPGVEPRHAQITCGAGHFKITAMSPTGRVVRNGASVHSHRLDANDLIELGVAQLLFLAEFEEQSAPQPTSASSLGVAPTGRLRVVSGPLEGTAFFLGNARIVIGRHELAMARLEGEGVAAFHALVYPRPAETAIIDLKSPGGIRVGGVRTTRHVLRDGDRVAIGAFTLEYSDLRAPTREAAAAARETREMPGVRVTEGAEIPDISLDVEVADFEDAFIRAGIKAPDRPQDSRPPKAYKPGQLKLICLEGPLEGQGFILRRPNTVIGRDAGADIQANTPSISRRHVEIRLEAACAIVRDLGSRNGTYVNGRRVNRKPLYAGDTIRIGQCLFIVEEVVPSAPRR